ncbi:MAG: hypothetical protein HYV07_28715 [Deltaproteobacteria bacterium]|nr:hypothetical protein [Deltaproteobacteria bacterium]
MTRAGIVAVRWRSSNGNGGACSGTSSWSWGVDLSTSQQTITIEAMDSGNNLGADTLIVSYTPIDEQPPEVSLTSPLDDDVGLMQVPVTGTVLDANLLKYDLECADNGDGVFFRIGGGTSQPANGVLGVIDATTLRNDLYTCRVCATDINNRSTCEERTIEVDGGAKVGIFTVSFNDLTIPVSGIPIKVTRTYDSRVKVKKDFGVGWELSVAAGRFTTNRKLGDSGRRAYAVARNSVCRPAGGSPARPASSSTGPVMSLAPRQVTVGAMRRYASR